MNCASNTWYVPDNINARTIFVVLYAFTCMYELDGVSVFKHGVIIG